MVMSMCTVWSHAKMSTDRSCNANACICEMPKQQNTLADIKVDIIHTQQHSQKESPNLGTNRNILRI